MNKIQEENFEISYNEAGHTINVDDNKIALDSYTVNVVVEFIKWYNNKKNEN